MARSRHGRAHWKLDAIDTYAGARPLAWIDDALDDECHRWAGERAAPTLLVATEPELGLTRREAQELERWARSLAARAELRRQQFQHRRDGGASASSPAGIDGAQ